MMDRAGSWGKHVILASTFIQHAISYQLPYMYSATSFNPGQEHHQEWQQPCRSSISARSLRVLSQCMRRQ